MTNSCVYDCQYCVNRCSNDVPRATFTPEELATLTMEFYRRNYIEGLFLSSGVLKDPDTSMERMCRVLELLRGPYRFAGYIHVKTIPGASPELIDKIGLLCDRMSVNIELPSERSLTQLAPDKSKQSILKPMGRRARPGGPEPGTSWAVYRHAPSFAPGGQSTQMIIGATPDTDYQIMKLASGPLQEVCSQTCFLLRVYSGGHPRPSSQGPASAPAAGAPPLPDRLAAAVLWLSGERSWMSGIRPWTPCWIRNATGRCIISTAFPSRSTGRTGKCCCGCRGIGVKSADRILSARRVGSLSFDDLKKIGVVLKRAIYFITCKGRMADGTRLSESFIYQNLTGGYPGCVRQPAPDTAGCGSSPSTICRSFRPERRTGSNA